MVFRQIRLTLLTAGVAVATVMTVVSQEATDSVPAIKPKAIGQEAGDVTRWISQLGSPRFQTRELATRNLIRSGATAIKPVQAAAGHYQLEVRRRAMAVMKAIYEGSSEVDSSNLAYDALQELVRSAPESSAQEAARILRVNVFLEQQRAITAIRAMKGQVQLVYDSPVTIGGEYIYPPQGWAMMVAIGEDWTGGTEGLREVLKLRDTLRTVYLLRGHPLPASSVLQLEAELPNLGPLGVQTRGDAFLGVRMGPEEGLGVGATIKVVEGQPAATGGLEDLDAVVEIDGKAVEDENDLVEIVREYAPGDVLPIVVLRGNDIDRHVLKELWNRPGSFSPLLAVGLVSRMRTEKAVTLGKWSIDN